jgi:hypothetical protein
MGIARPKRRDVAWACVAAAAVTLCAGLLVRGNALTDWDSWDYAALAVQGRPSSLCLGRWWFITFLRGALWIGEAAGADRLYCFVPMQLAVLAASAAAAGLLILWTWRLTGSVKGAIAAGAIVVISPTFMAYSSAVMSEAPSLLFLMLGFLGWEAALGRAGAANAADAVAGGAAAPRRAARWTPALLALLGGLAFGVAVNMREPLLMLGAWPIVSCLTPRRPGRWRLLGVAAGGAICSLAVGIFMAWTAWGPETTPLDVLRNYNSYMAGERLTRGFDSAANVRYLLLHTVTAAPLGPAMALAGLCLLWRKRRRLFSDASAGRGPADCNRPPENAENIKRAGLRRAAWAAVSSLPLAAFTWYNPDLSFNWRLALPLAWMLAPLMGLLSVEALGVLFNGAGKTSPGRFFQMVAAGGCAAAISWTGISGLWLLNHHKYASEQGELFASLQSLPSGSVIVPGPASTAAQYLQRLGFKPDWTVIQTEPDWTGPGLLGRVSGELDKGRRAFIYARPAGWKRGGGYNPEWDAVEHVLKSFAARSADGAFVEIMRPATTRPIY